MELSFDNNDELKQRGKAAFLTLIISVLIFILLYLITYSMPQIPPPQNEMGMLVNLGDSDNGSGNEQPLSDDTETETNSAKAKSSDAAAQPPQMINTQDVEDAPAVESANKSKTSAAELKKKPIENAKPDPKKIEAAKAAKEAADRKAKEDAFKNRLKGLMNKTNTSKNEGEGSGTGDQGDPNGDPNAKNHIGQSSGLGTAGNGWDIKGLKGRTPRKQPAISDKSKEEGKVAVNITVDKRGKVVNARYTEKGSTTSNQYLVNLALKSAREFIFNDKEEDGDQMGTIIFNFKNQ